MGVSQRTSKERFPSPGGKKSGQEKLVREKRKIKQRINI
jgi:hypothetical protein